MANTPLTIDMVTSEALEIAHEKLSFIGTVNRQYDKSFAVTGGKIGDTLRIREPNQFLRRKGSRIMDVQDVEETSQNATVATQDGVDISFHGSEWALSIDDFAERYLEPAISVLVSGIEGDMLSAVTKDVYNVVGTAGTPAGTAATAFDNVGLARAKLNQGLAPKDGKRFVQADSITMSGLVKGFSGLFQDSQQIKEQYNEGMIGRTGMADFFENERTYAHTTGSDFTTVTVNDAAIVSGDAAITVAGGSFLKGDVFTFDGVFAIHPETKISYAHLQQFTATADGTTALAFDPPLRASSTDPRQNVSALPANGAALVFIGSASTTYRQNLMYHKDAFTFITADLPIPRNVASSRKVKDGLSIRIWEGNDIKNDTTQLIRMDILYGWKTLRPAWATRITN
jgi:hypothetical protein